MKKNIFISLLVVIDCSHAACNPNIPLTAPNTRYELINNGNEVRDIQTTLIWQRCSLGQIWDGKSCTGIANTYNWTNALQTAANMSNGWRVPNIKELSSLIEEACDNPSINISIFPNTKTDTWYWSSSTLFPLRYNKWMYSFNEGYARTNDSNSNYYVRLVRSN